MTKASGRLSVPAGVAIVTDKCYRIDTHGPDMGAHNFVCDATHVLEACPESGTSHVISPFLTHPIPVSAAHSCFDASRTPSVGT